MSNIPPPPPPLPSRTVTPVTFFGNSGTVLDFSPQPVAPKGLAPNHSGAVETLEDFTENDMKEVQETLFQ